MIVSRDAASGFIARVPGSKMKKIGSSAGCNRCSLGVSAVLASALGLLETSVLATRLAWPALLEGVSHLCP